MATNVTNATNVTDAFAPRVEENFANLVDSLDYYVTPAIICIGLLGNTLSFIVFVFTGLKTLSSSIYLAALSVSDSGFLICVLFSWLVNIDIQIYHEPGWCQTFAYLTYVFSFLSVW